VPIRSYYRALNTFKGRIIDLTISKEAVPGVNLGAKLQSFGNRVVRRPFEMGEKTWKMPGELFKVRNKSGKAWAWDRKGSVYAVDIKCDVDFTFILELFDGKWYLISVDRYRGFRPFHSLALMEYFLERVWLSIDGSAVNLPRKVHDLHNPPFWAEGIVFRRGFNDFLYRFHHSFDVDEEGYDDMLKTLRDAGLILRTVAEKHTEGIHEYLLKQDGVTYDVVDLGVRQKLTTDDSKAIKKMLLWPTLYNELYGVKTNIKGTEINVDDETDTDGEGELSN